MASGKAVLQFDLFDAFRVGGEMKNWLKVRDSCIDLVVEGRPVQPTPEGHANDDGLKIFLLEMARSQSFVENVVIDREFVRGNDCVPHTGEREEKRLDRVNSLTKGYFISRRTRECELICIGPFESNNCWLT